ncbi:MAG: citryl-CoA lyase [Theionarchaea archaeon]|nr:citryl-CoA lyase [Theionarchaea archaeon]
MWNTGITKVEPNKLVTRGYKQDELIGNVPFSHVVYLLLKGDLPDEKTGKLFDAMITASIDHGPTPPSAQAARIVCSGGVPLPTAVAAGLMAVGDYHGGAIENAMKILYELVDKKNKEGKSVQQTAEEAVKEFREKKRIMPGLGHRIHTDDPRTKKLFTMAKDLGVYSDHTAMLQAFRDEFAKSSGKDLPINVDGALAALACDMGFDYKLGKALFLMGRIAGLVAHVHEELTREKPMRKFDPEFEYDGPSEKPLPAHYR